MTTLPHSRLKTNAHLPNAFNWSTVKQGFARRDLVPAIPTAALCWFLTVIFSVSLAALIFRGPLAPYLPLGIGVSMITAVAVGLVTTFTSSIPGCVAIPSDRTAPMLAILAGSIAASFPPGDPAILPTCLAALICATGLNGVVLWLLGHFRMGILVRFLPYPVVGGFMAGAGWLLVKGALTVATGFEVHFSNIPALFATGTLLRWVPSLAIACILLIVTRRTRHYLVIPGIVTAGLILFYVVNGFVGLSLPQLREIGWLPAPFPTAVSWHPVSIDLLSTAHWATIAAHLVTFGTILMVSAISLLMISSSLELSARVEVDADREFQAAGLANLASLFMGGMVGFHSLSISSLALRIGPNSRWVGLFAAGGTALTLFFAPKLVSYLPVPLLSALLLFLGLNFLVEWLFDAFRKMRRTDYLIIVAILIVVAWAGYLIAVGFGLILALTLFTLRYSLIDVVRLEMTGSQHRSNVDRTPEQLAILNNVRPSIHILKLQGFIFFGTAYSLLQRVRARTHDHQQVPLRYLILDFRHVTGIDSSALLSLSKLMHIGQQSDFATLCSGVPPSVFPTLRRDAIVTEGFSFHTDADHAVEWCEARELTAKHIEITSPPVSIETMLEKLLPDRPEMARKLASHFEPHKIFAGDVLAIQGDRTRELFLILNGKVSALLKAQNGDVIRLRTMGPSSIVGEIGLYLGLPRTATLVAETDAVVWRLSPDTVAKLEQDDPRSASALHEILARILASRLIQANELLEISLR
jgi:sulfate permease, SulP family